MSPTEQYLDEVVVEIWGLSRRFDNRSALDRVNLVVRRGETWGVMGSNGSGKTTLLQHVVGGLKAQSGTVRVLGRDPAVDPVTVLQRVGYLPEQDDLPAECSVAEILQYLESVTPGWDPSYAEMMRQRFGLDNRAKPSQLSRGQRAQVQLIAAVAHHPELLVLDTPSSVLDTSVREAIMLEIIPTLIVKNGAVLFASHLPEEVERMADFAVMLEEGRVRECLTVSEQPGKFMDRS